MNPSKLLDFPVFKPIPQTDLANVQENIENWKKRGCAEMLETFCRPDTFFPSGYRFINCSDVIESITTNQNIKGIPFKVTYKRYLRARDSFCPLWFTEHSIEVTLTYDELKFEFKSDNHLKKMISEIKKMK